MKILITGVAGRLGRLVAAQLLSAGHKVLGIDRRPWPDAPDGVTIFNADVRKRPAEDVFRTHKPDAVIHMATVSHLNARSEERYRINLKGTQTVFTYCSRYAIKQCLFVGRHTFYGAAADAALYHKEEDPPMAVTTFPQLADMIAADLYAGTALWRFPDMKTAVLRMSYTLGPLKHGTLASFLSSKHVGTVLGFDPLFQFIHEVDAARAICTALESQAHGIFNVAGPQPVPLSLLLEVTGRKNIRIPEMFFESATGRFGLRKISRGAINHIKYPVVVDDALFREQTGFEHTYSEICTMEAFRWSGLM